MPIAMLVQVRLDDAADLSEIVETVDGAGPVGSAQPFDGEAVAQVLVLMNAAVFPFFKTWAQGRVAARKGFKVIVNGVELSGYAAEEVASILEHVQREIETDDDAESGT
jgi:hypothetical protein